MISPSLPFKVAERPNLRSQCAGEDLLQLTMMFFPEAIDSTFSLKLLQQIQKNCSARFRNGSHETTEEITQKWLRRLPRLKLCLQSRRSYTRTARPSSTALRGAILQVNRRCYRHVARPVHRNPYPTRRLL